MPVLEPQRRSDRWTASWGRKENRDLLVVQTRSARGLQIRLRVLGLTGTGTVRVLASRNALVRRVLSELLRKDQVTVRPLAASALRYGSTRTAVEPAQTAYRVQGGRALQFEFPTGDRLNVEPSKEEFSMAWTTNLPSDTLLGRLEPLIAGRGDTGLIVNDDGEFRELAVSANEAVPMLVSEGQSRFWRVDFDDRSLTWERGEPNVPGAPDVGLMGFIGAVYEPEYLRALIEATATLTIGANAQALLEACVPVIDAATPPRRERAEA